MFRVLGSRLGLRTATSVLAAPTRASSDSLQRLVEDVLEDELKTHAAFTSNGDALTDLGFSVREVVTAPPGAKGGSADRLGSTAFVASKSGDDGERLEVEFRLAEEEEEEGDEEAESDPHGLHDLIGGEGEGAMFDSFEVRLTRPEAPTAVLSAHCEVVAGGTDYAVASVAIAANDNALPAVHEFPTADEENSHPEAELSVGHEAEIEDGILDYLESLGVDAPLVSAINDFLHHQVHADYVEWLRRMNTFLK